MSLWIQRSILHVSHQGMRGQEKSRRRIAVSLLVAGGLDGRPGLRACSILYEYGTRPVDCVEVRK